LVLNGNISDIFPSGKKEDRECSERTTNKVGQNFSRFIQKLFFLSYPISALEEIMEQLKSGALMLDGEKIITGPIDISSLNATLDWPIDLEKKDEWKALIARAGSKLGYSLDVLESQNGVARLHGYDDIYELLNEVLRIKGFSRGVDWNFTVSIPVYAKIKKFSAEGDSANFQVRFHTSLTGLQLNLVAQRSNRIHYYQTFARKPWSIGKHRKVNGISNLTMSVELAGLRHRDIVKGDLIQKSFPAISIDGASAMVGISNPTVKFAQVLADFCSVDVFKRRLLRPEECKEGKLTVSGIFENAVAWLISLHGYEVLHLHEQFEHLRIAATSYEVGSLDILAHKNGRILLVDCDTSAPEPKKASALANVKRSLAEKQVRSGLEFTPMIFTPRDCGDLNPAAAVMIVDKPKIETLFEEAMTGKKGPSPIL
jgi:hypothetical protein